MTQLMGHGLKRFVKPMNGLMRSEARVTQDWGRNRFGDSPEFLFRYHNSMRWIFITEAWQPQNRWTALKFIHNGTVGSLGYPEGH